MRRRRRRIRLRLDRSGPWIGVGGVVVVLWLSVAAAILYAPWWGMVLLAGLLIAQVVLVRRWATTHPGRCVAVPLVGFVAWLALVLAGAWWFGWEMKV